MKIKTIIACVSAVLVAVAVVTAALWVSHIPDDTVCQQVEIVLCDSAEYQFVSENELLRVLKSQGLLPVGRKMDEVSCHEIETAISQHDMVRTAECYELSDGTLRVRATQRVPLLCVQTAEGKYFVDMDRRVMPARPSIQMSVPIIKGVVGQRAATQEYYDFVQWLNSDRYWRDRITHIHVRNPKYVVLAQREVQGNIVLGELTDYQNKMDRLRKLYVKGFDEIGYQPYKEYDVRFEGQVVGRK